VRQHFYRKVPPNSLANQPVSYRVAKVLHLAGLVLWLGPTTGGYALIIIARLNGDVSAELWLFEAYLKLIYIEAFGLLLLLFSGAAMLMRRPAYRNALWLRLKLAIVLLIFIPLEAIQLVIYLLWVKPAFASGGPVQTALEAFDRFSLIAIIILAAAIPAVLYLAVFKPGGRDH
jgi:hypothetical protein